MKIKITAYRAVAEWKWDLPEGADDTCGICRSQFEGTCEKCRYPGDDCPISKCEPPPTILRERERQRRSTANRGGDGQSLASAPTASICIASPTGSTPRRAKAPVRCVDSRSRRRWRMRVELPRVDAGANITTTPRTTRCVAVDIRNEPNTIAGSPPAGSYGILDEHYHETALFLPTKPSSSRAELLPWREDSAPRYSNDSPLGHKRNV